MRMIPQARLARRGPRALASLAKLVHVTGNRRVLFFNTHAETRKQGFLCALPSDCKIEHLSQKLANTIGANGP